MAAVPALLVDGYSQHPLCFTSLPDYAPKYTQARLRPTSPGGSLNRALHWPMSVPMEARTVCCALDGDAQYCRGPPETLIAQYSQNSGSTRWCSLSDRVEFCTLFDRSCQGQLPRTSMTGGKISSSLRTYYSAGGVDLAKKRAARWVRSES